MQDFFHAANNLPHVTREIVERFHVFPCIARDNVVYCYKAPLTMRENVKHRNTTPMPTDYMPDGDAEFRQWLNNFADSFAANATTLGFNAADIASVRADADAITYCLNAVETFRTEYGARVQFKEDFLKGDLAVGNGSDIVTVTIV